MWIAYTDKQTDRQTTYEGKQGSSLEPQFRMFTIDNKNINISVL